jgi:protein-tyrosine phosphatase
MVRQHGLLAGGAADRQDVRMSHVSVLFVCMGNICRSPMAEAVFRAQVEAAGLASDIHVDSAGTHSYHLGHEPHPGTQAELERRGIPVGAQRSRLIEAEDFDTYDYIVVMDRENLANVQALLRDAELEHAGITLLLAHAEAGSVDVDEVPDPYYVGGYERVYDLVESGSRGLLASIRRDLAG